jgi:predicted ArsR family transcriptional regulator
MNYVPYQGKLPFVADSDTSEAAGESLAGAVTALRQKVLAKIEEEGEATCDEVEVFLGMPHQTASARIRELSLMGLIVDTGDRRKTRSGRLARVYASARHKDAE